MARLETIAIKREDRQVLINLRDYDPAVHTFWEAPDEQEKQAPVSSESPVVPVLDRMALKRRADELGVEYWPRIPTEMLKERIDVAEGKV